MYAFMLKAVFLSRRAVLTHNDCRIFFLFPDQMHADKMEIVFPFSCFSLNSTTRDLSIRSLTGYWSKGNNQTVTYNDANIQLLKGFNKNVVCLG